MATFTGAIGTASKWLLDKIVGAVAATGINPNVLTFLGLVVNFIAAAFFAVGGFFLGALIILFAGFLDMLDGQVARRQNRVTAFGAFYDSTLDRYADMALYMGLLVYYSVSGRTPHDHAPFLRLVVREDELADAFIETPAISSARGIRVGDDSMDRSTSGVSTDAGT